MTLHKYWTSACPSCPIKAQCTTGDVPPHHALGARGGARGDAGTAGPHARGGSTCDDRPSSTSFGTLKAWMGSTHFLTKTLPRVRTEMSLHVLAYNLKRVIKILGAATLISAMRA